MWPDLSTHLKMRQDFPIDHGRINAFHARHGHIPQLSAPRGYQAWAQRFHATELEGRPLVIINPRQSSLTENPTVTYRDAPLPAWHAFIDAVAEKRPEALFVMVGGFQEWEHRLLRRRNVFIPRAWGLRLSHELALLKIADLFMGTSSGFATFATFTDIAYAIVNVEHSFAGPAEVRVNDRHFPFAKANQILTWRRETSEELLSLFDEVYAGVRPIDAAKTRMPAVTDRRERVLAFDRDWYRMIQRLLIHPLPDGRTVVAAFQLDGPSDRSSRGCRDRDRLAGAAGRQEVGIWNGRARR